MKFGKESPYKTLFRRTRYIKQLAKTGTGIILDSEML